MTEAVTEEVQRRKDDDNPQKKKVMKAIVDNVS